MVRCGAGIVRANATAPAQLENTAIATSRDDMRRRRSVVFAGLAVDTLPLITPIIDTLGAAGSLCQGGGAENV